MHPRFFLPERIEIGATLALDDDERHHARVLRVREGEEIEVFDGRGSAFTARFESAGAVRIIAPAPARELAMTIHLAAALIQVEKFEWVLQKATELGAASFIPLIAERGEVRADRVRGKEERWRKIVLEAVKQSGRSRIPPVEPVAKFEDVLERQGDKTIFDADELPSAGGPPGHSAILLIGPEGGWSEREIAAARAAGCVFRRLGARRLRAETAAIVAVALTAAGGGERRDA